MNRNAFLFSCLLCLFLVSCRHKLNPDELYGKWNYVKVESLTNPEENLSDAEVKVESPSIEFSKNGELTIIWGRRVLSKGKFTLENEIIRYVEELPGGATRPIPFLIKQLSGNQLIFETMDREGTRITAIK